MLVLTRAEGESIVLDETIKVTVLEIRDNELFLGIVGTAPLLRPSVETESTPAISSAYVMPNQPSEFVVRCVQGDVFNLTNGVKLSVVWCPPGIRRVKLGIEAPAYMRVDRLEVRDELLKRIDEYLPASSPLVNVVFQDDDFSDEEIELVLKYLSAVTRENGGNGLKVVKGRHLEPVNEEVVS